MIRTITYNVYDVQGWTAEDADGAGAARADDVGVTDELCTALREQDPDIVTFAEAPSRDVVHDIGSRLGLSVQFFPSGGNWPGALLSAIPIERATPARELFPDTSGDLFTRHVGRTTFKTDFGSVVFYSAHLHPFDEAVRAREVATLRTAIRDDLDAQRNVVLQGDLNHRPSDPEYDDWANTGLIDSYATVGVGPAETITAHAPKRRLDYIWVGGPLTDRLQQARVLRSQPFGPGKQTAAAGTFLSDHLPVLAELE